MTSPQWWTNSAVDQPGQVIGAQPSYGGGSSYQTQGSAQQQSWQQIASEYARQYDLDYQLKKSELDQKYQYYRQSAKTADEKNQIDREYNQAQIALARDRLEQDQTQFIIGQSGRLPDGSPTLSLQQLQSQNEQTAAQLTGIYQGNPTLAAINQQQQYGLQVGGLTGTFNGQQTLPSQQLDLAKLTQQQQNVLATAGLMGRDANGNLTLAGTQQQATQALAQAGLMGYDQYGNPTADTTQFATTSSGYDAQGRPTLARETQMGQLGVQQGQLQLSREQTAANLAGSADPFASMSFARGATSDGQSPAFLTSLRNGTSLAGFSPMGGTPTPLTMGTLAERAGGYGAGAGSSGPLVSGPIDQYGNPIGPGGGQQSPAFAGGGGGAGGYMVRNPDGSWVQGGGQQQPVAPQQPMVRGGGGLGSMAPGGGSWTTDANGQWSPVDASRPLTNSAGGPDPNMYTGGSPGFSESGSVGSPWFTSSAPSTSYRMPVRQSSVTQNWLRSGDAALSDIGAIGQAGGGKLGAGALENLNEDEMNTFTAGLKRKGYSVPSFLQNYRNSRIMNNYQNAGAA